MQIADLIFEEVKPGSFYYKKPGVFSALITKEPEEESFSFVAAHKSLTCATSHFGTLEEIEGMLNQLKSI